MKMVKIRFPDEETCDHGSYELMKAVRVTCLPDDEYLIPERSLSVLDDLSLPYTIFESCNLDHALKTLRNSAAAPL